MIGLYIAVDDPDARADDALRSILSNKQVVGAFQGRTGWPAVLTSPGRAPLGVRAHHMRMQ